jgi:hypothetical protein
MSPTVRGTLRRNAKPAAGSTWLHIGLGSVFARQIELRRTDQAVQVVHPLAHRPPMFLGAFSRFRIALDWKVAEQNRRRFEGFTILVFTVP